VQEDDGRALAGGDVVEADVAEVGVVVLKRIGH
jgi:hypothetical protein